MHGCKGLFGSLKCALDCSWASVAPPHWDGSNKVFPINGILAQFYDQETKIATLKNEVKCYLQEKLLDFTDSSSSSYRCELGSSPTSEEAFYNIISLLP